MLTDLSLSAPEEHDLGGARLVDDDGVVVALVKGGAVVVVQAPKAVTLYSGDGAKDGATRWGGHSGDQRGEVTLIRVSGCWVNLRRYDDGEPEDVASWCYEGRSQDRACQWRWTFPTGRT